MATKVALITGAANGFGKVFAMEAVNRGMKVAIVDIDGDDLFGTTAVLIYDQASGRKCFSEAETVARYRNPLCETP